MTQTLLVVVLFVAAMAALPWLVRRLQQRNAGRLSTAAGVGASRVLSAVAVGPHQRVVTVEVGPEQQRTVLVLGVTAQQINCLHVLPGQGLGQTRAQGHTPLPATALPVRTEPGFAGEMAAASARQEAGHHG